MNKHASMSLLVSRTRHLLLLEEFGIYLLLTSILSLLEYIYWSELWGWTSSYKHISRTIKFLIFYHSYVTTPQRIKLHRRNIVFILIAFQQVEPECFPTFAVFCDVIQCGLVARNSLASYQITLRHIAEYIFLHNNHCQTTKSHLNLPRVLSKKCEMQLSV